MQARLFARTRFQRIGIHCLMAALVLPLCLGQSCGSPASLAPAGDEQVAGFQPEEPPAGGGDTTTGDTTTNDGTTTGGDEIIEVDPNDRTAAVVANAGPDIDAIENTLVTLNAGGSTGRAALTYAWKQVSGRAVTLTSANQAICTFTAPQITVEPELFKFEVTVTTRWSGRTYRARDVVWVSVRKVPVSGGGGGGAALPPITTPFTGVAPTLDGTLAANEWSDAGNYPLDGSDTNQPGVLVQGSSASLPDSNATLYVKHDQNYLYVAVQMTDDALIATSTDPNQPWLADLVEVFLDSDNSNSKVSFPGTAAGFHLAINAGGEVNGSLIGTGAWDAAAATGAGQWVAEFRISKSAAGLVNGGTYGFDVAVHDYDQAGQTTPETLYQFFGTSRIWGSDGLMDESLYGDITLTEGAPGSLSVFSGDLVASGNRGGPFSPAALSYLISNNGGLPIDWNITSAQSWVTPSKANGSLIPGAYERVEITINNNANTLTTGTYTNVVTFSNVTNSVGNTTRRVELTIAESGVLAVSPAGDLSSSGSQGGPFSPGSAAYTLSNSGDSAIDWTASKTQSWVTLSKSGGTLAAGATDTVIVSIGSGASSLAAGSHSDTVTFANTTNGAGTTTRTVGLTVTSPGTLAVSPATGFSSSGNQGGPFSPASATYTLSNSGGSPVNWTAAKTQSWVTLSKSGGTLAAGATDTVIVSIGSGASSLAAGSYNDTVTFTNTTSGTVVTTRTVGLSVSALGALSISPAGGLTSSGNMGGPFAPGSITYTLSNSGGAPLNWTAAKTQTWVTLSKSGGTLAAGATDTVVVSIGSDANSLSAGNRSDTVTFTNTTTGSGNATRPVSLSITTPGSLSISPAGGLTSSGNVGGPFSPASITYTLSNPGGSSINWTAGKTQTWVTLSKTSGTLAAGGTDTVTVSYGTGANSLTSGTKTDTVTFTNSTNGSGNGTRPVALHIVPALTISSTPSTGTAPLAVQLRAMAGGSVVTTAQLPTGSTLNWIYGDGTANGTGTQVNHTYSTAGSFLVALTLTLPAGLGTVSCNQQTLQVLSSAPAGPMTAPYGTTAVTLNGVLASGEWSDAQQYTMNGADTTPPGITVQGANTTTSDSSATIYVKHDASYLYIAVSVTDNALVTTSSDVNQPWLADLVEIYLDSDNSNSKLGFPGTAGGFHAGINAGGEQVGSLIGGGTWDAAAATGSGQWVAEFRISKSATSMANGGTYGFDVAVHDYDQAGQTTPETLYQYFSLSRIWGSDGLMDESLYGDIILQAPSNPLLSVNVTSLDFGSTGTTLPITVTNTGVSTLSYSISSNAAWLTTSPTSGTSTGEQDTINVNVNRGSLASGTYNGTLTINGGAGGTATVAVSMQVQAGTLSVTGTAGLSSSGMAGGPFSPASVTYTLSNTGNSSINWTASKTQSWVTLSKTSGTLASGATDTVTVSINSGANSLAAGSFADTVTFTNTTNNNGNTTRSVSLSANSSSGLAMTTANRTSGVAPLAVFFDAVPVNSGVVQPASSDYGGMYYEWDFGDPASGTWSTTGKSKNRATGYVAAHVYEEPGTYNVSLKVTTAAGEVFNYQQTITVQAFSGTTYYVSNSLGNDSNAGTSEASPFKTFSKAMSVVGTNRRILFKRGDTFSSGGATIGSAGPGIIGAYGTGAAPVVNMSGSSAQLFISGADWRVMDIEVVGPGNSDVAGIEGGGIVRSLIQRVTVRNFLGIGVGIAHGWSGALQHSENFVVDCYVHHNSINGYPCGKKLVLLGNRFETATGSHACRVWHADKAVLSHNTFLDPGGDRLALKFHNEVEINPPMPTAQYAMISDNTFRGNTTVVAIAPQYAGANEKIDQVIFERNTVQANGMTQGALIVAATNVTVRNNVFNATSSEIYYMGVMVKREGTEPAPANIKVLNNTFYKGDNGSELTCISISSGTNIEVRNNLGSAPNFNGYMKVFLSNSVSITQSNNLFTNTAGFVSPGSGNFALQNGSAARDAGTTLPHVRDSFTDVSRPQGAQYDIGAYEQ